MIVELCTPQSAYHVGHQDDASGSLDELVYTAMYAYLRNDLGLSRSVAEQRAEAEANGRLTKSFCDECETLGLEFPGKLVLDLGAGLGGLSAEMARRGAQVLALEPGAAWRSIAAGRVSEAGTGLTIGAVGESLPVASNSVDLVVSLQVLEHVRDRKQVIEEVYRILRPGGHFFFAYENYLSFWEPHYRVRWLPLLPKRIGAAYLRRLGRDPKFLLEAVTYTTFPAVRRFLCAAGFACTRRDTYLSAFEAPEKVSLKWKALKTLAALHKPSALNLLLCKDFLERLPKTAISELVRKPST